jgi:hypothetical protein
LAEKSVNIADSGINEFDDDTACHSDSGYNESSTGDHCTSAGSDPANSCSYPRDGTIARDSSADSAASSASPTAACSTEAVCARIRHTCRIDTCSSGMAQTGTIPLSHDFLNTIHG